MPGSKKESFLGLLVFVLLGVVVFETGLILFSNSIRGDKPGFMGLGLKQSATKEPAPAWAQYLQPEWNPFQEMMILRERVNHMINDVFNRGLTNPALQSMSEQFAFYEPEVDITEAEKNVIVKCDLPGIEKEKIDVEVKNNFITIKGVRNIISKIEGSPSGFFRKERRYGSFTKTFLLPVPVDESHAKASYQDGVLTVELPKLFPGPKEDKLSKIVVS